MRCALALPTILLLSTASAFYLPGVAPTSYQEGDKVPLHVNRLNPAQSQEDGQVHSALSFDYYSAPFHFCKPQGGPQYVSESLGSIIFGDRIQTSPFELLMARNQSCKTIPQCGPQKYEAIDAKFVNARIAQSFELNWLIDGLPAGQLLLDPTTNSEFYSPGFELGHMDGKKAVFNNHYDIYIDYHEASSGLFRVVGILVEPSSNKNAKEQGPGMGQCDHEEDLVLDEKGGTQAIFTYSVYWRPSSTPFATRWDKYLHVYDPKIHWFSLVNSAIIVIFLSAMVFVILVRTLRKDITRYNRLDEFVLDDVSSTGHANVDTLDDGVQDDSGWKLVHGDVFRPPTHPLLLSILVGNGAQLFMMTGFTIAFALLGFLSPSNRGSVGSIMILLYTVFGFIGGFVSTYTYRTLLAGAGDEAARTSAKTKQNIIITPVALPSIVFGSFFLLDLFLWAKGSSGAVPFTTMLIIILIWFIISVPLSLGGSYLALRRTPAPPPTRTNQIPRQIPHHTTASTSLTGLLNRPLPSILLTGILPFGAIFVEIHFILSSLWSAKIYYMFGFLFVCYGLMIVTCATVTVLSIYFVLCSEDYRWQWRSFATGGACSFYVFVNAMVFWGSRLSFGSVTSGVLYLGYSALISLLVFVLTGTIGFLCSWVFVHRIYRSLKVD